MTVLLEEVSVLLEYLDLLLQNLSKKWGIWDGGMAHALGPHLHCLCCHRFYNIIIASVYLKK